MTKLFLMKYQNMIKHGMKMKSRVLISRQALIRSGGMSGPTITEWCQTNYNDMWIYIQFILSCLKLSIVYGKSELIITNKKNCQNNLVIELNRINRIYQITALRCIGMYHVCQKRLNEVTQISKYKMCHRLGRRRLCANYSEDKDWEQLC